MNEKRLWVIRFDFPEEGAPVLYAGEYKGGLGYAPTTKTALQWINPETPARILANGYGSMAEYGSVVELDNNV